MSDVVARIEYYGFEVIKRGDDYTIENVDLGEPGLVHYLAQFELLEPVLSAYHAEADSEPPDDGNAAEQPGSTSRPGEQRDLSAERQASDDEADDEPPQRKFTLLREPGLDGHDFDIHDLCYSVGAIGAAIERSEGDIDLTMGLASAAKVVGTRAASSPGSNMRPSA